MKTLKRTTLSNNDFNLLEHYANKVFRHSDDWFYDKYYSRKTVDTCDLSDLRDAFTADDSIDLAEITAGLENKKIAEIIGVNK